MNALKQLCILSLGLTMLLWIAIPAASATEITPTQAYLDYTAALIKATTLSDILPYLSAEYRGMLESRPKKDQQEWLKNLKEDLMKDIKITKETVTGKRSTLEATGVSKRGNKMKGKIILVKEGASWKLDEQFWGTTGG